MTDDTNQTPDLDVQPEDAPEDVTGDEIAASVAALAADDDVDPDVDPDVGAGEATSPETDAGEDAADDASAETEGDAEVEGDPEVDDDAPRSIDELVAGLRGADDAPVDDEGSRAAATGEGVELVESLPIDPDDDLSAVEGEASARLVSIVESLLFAANRPLKVRELRRVLGSEPTKRQVQLALKKLEEDTADRGVVLRQVAGGFVLRTNPDNARYVQKLLQSRPVRLSRPQLETLAVIVYRQPITRAEIDHVRGVDSGAVLKLLLERDLIKIVGRKEEPGRPMLYGTTVKFLEFFELKSLRDLPDLREFTELSEHSKERLSKTMDDDEVEAFGQEVLDFARASEEDAEGDEDAEAVEGGETRASEDANEEDAFAEDADGQATDAEDAGGEATDAEATETEAAEAEATEAETAEDETAEGSVDDEPARAEAAEAAETAETDETVEQDAAAPDEEDEDPS